MSWMRPTDPYLDHCEIAPDTSGGYKITYYRFDIGTAKWVSEGTHWARTKFGAKRLAKRLLAVTDPTKIMKVYG